MIDFRVPAMQEMFQSWFGKVGHSKRRHRVVTESVTEAGDARSASYRPFELSSGMCLPYFKGGDVTNTDQRHRSEMIALIPFLRII